MKTIEAESGQTIFGAVYEAIKIANEDKKTLRLIFNDIRIIVSPLSYVEDLLHIYHLENELRIVS